MATSIKVAAAKIVEQRTHQIPGKLRVTEHFFDVPKDYSKPDSGTIRIFARSVRKHESPADPSDHDAKKSQLPWMVFLNGGPGGPCRHPSAYPFTWTILDKGYQMLYLDQRGTGLSTPITP
ncbi:alpha/beta-hydrolase, partial [Aureobasidium melanogenum]